MKTGQKCWKCKLRLSTQKNGFCRPCRAEYGRKYRKENREKDKAYTQDYRRRNPEKCRGWYRRAYLTKTYRISLEQFEDLLRVQKGLCACCEESLTTPCVDHDHKTNKVRGLLCRLCNAMLGQAKDRPEILRAGAEYLEKKRRHVVIETER